MSPQGNTIPQSTPTSGTPKDQNLMFSSADLPNVKANAKKDYFVNVENQTLLQKIKTWFLKKRYASETKQPSSKNPVRQNRRPLIIALASVAAILTIGIIVAVVVLNNPKTQTGSTQTTSTSSTMPVDIPDTDPSSPTNVAANEISTHLDEIFSDSSDENPESTALSYLSDLTSRASHSEDYDALYRVATVEASFWGSRGRYDLALAPLLDLDPSNYDQERQYVIYYTIYNIYDILGETDNASTYLAFASQIHPVETQTDDEEGPHEEYTENPASNGPQEDQSNSEGSHSSDSQEESKNE